MKFRKILKTTLCTAAAVSAFLAFGLDAFSLVDFSAGESGLISNDTTKYKVNITADGKTAAVVPIGIGIRGDADESGDISLYDAVAISKYIMGIAPEGFEDSLGFAMSDTNLSGKVDLYDAINVAKYLITQGTHEERWQAILGS